MHSYTAYVYIALHVHVVIDGLIGLLYVVSCLQANLPYVQVSDASRVRLSLITQLAELSIASRNLCVCVCVCVLTTAVSYTHLTLPTIYSV